MDKNGVFESISAKHSWDGPQRYTSYMLFRVQRHSDHYINAYKPYQALVDYEESPILPMGYVASMVIALCPPIFFTAHDPIVKAFNDDIKLSKTELGEIETLLNKYLIAVNAVIILLCYVIA